MPRNQKIPSPCGKGIFKNKIEKKFISFSFVLASFFLFLIWRL